MKSEPSKWLPILLSIIVSGLSWWEAHRNRIINQEISRPELKASKVVVDGSWSKGEGKIGFKACYRAVSCKGLLDGG